MPVVSFSVPFVRGKLRVRTTKRGSAYTPDKTAEAMELIRLAYDRASGGKSAPKGAPVSVTIITSRPMPKSRPKKLTSEPDTFKPDVDNIAKLVLDALNGFAWDDDTQVAQLQVKKHPRTRDSEACTAVQIDWLEV